MSGILISDIEAARRYRDLLDTVQSMKGPGDESWRRSNLPVSWSTLRPVEVPPRANVPGAAPTEVAALAMQGSDGAPRSWQVQGAGLGGAPGGTGSQLSRFGQYLRMRWTCGGVTNVAEIDITAGGFCFPVVADSIAIYGVNDDITVSLYLTISIAPSDAFADFRAPRRTVRYLQDTVSQATIQIPAFAQRFQWLARQTANRDLVIEDVAGNDIAYLNYPATTTAGTVESMIELPAGAGQIFLPANAGALAGAAAFVFYLGF